MYLNTLMNILTPPDIHPSRDVTGYPEFYPTSSLHLPEYQVVWGCMITWLKSFLCIFFLFVCSGIVVNQVYAQEQDTLEVRPTPPDSLVNAPPDSLGNAQTDTLRTPGQLPGNSNPQSAASNGTD